MASNQTSHYGLSQWQPADNFSRADFNSDHSKIDTALHAIKTSGEGGVTALRQEVQQGVATLTQQTERLAGQLVPVSYHVYNLLLQQYYDGKEAGYKKALLFNGFLDRDGVVQGSSGVIARDGALWVDTVGQSGYDTGRTDSTSGFSNTTVVEQTWVAAANGNVTAVKLYLSPSVPANIFRLDVLRDGAVIASTSGGTRSSEDTVTVSIAWKAEGNAVYTLRVTTTAGNYSYYQSASSSQHFAYGIVCTPTPATSGVMIGPSQDMGVSFTHAVGWVRWQGEQPSLYLDGGSGAWHKLAAQATRPATELRGERCSETAFALTLNGGPTARVKLTLPRTCKVFDYGAALL